MCKLEKLRDQHFCKIHHCTVVCFNSTKTSQKYKFVIYGSILQQLQHCNKEEFHKNVDHIVCPAYKHAGKMLVNSILTVVK